jgi:hypothetical protein
MTRHRYLRISALALLTGPLLLAVADLVRRLVEPSGTPSATAVTRAVGEHQAAWQVAALLALLSGPLLVLGVSGLALDARGRGCRTTMVGVWLVAIGSFAAIGHAVAFYTPYALYDLAGVSPSAIDALDDASESYLPLVMLIVLFIAGTMLGAIVLLVGLRRARRVPVWSPVAAVVFVAAGSSGGVLTGVVGVVAALAAFGPAARSLVAPAVPATRDRTAREATLPG